jgi:hypothetical protein
MAATKVPISLPDGSKLNGTEVGVDESTERWTDLALNDGTKLRVKQAILQVIRLDGQYDPEGNPLYVIKGMPMMFLVSAPNNLKRKTQ